MNIASFFEEEHLLENKRSRLEPLAEKTLRVLIADSDGKRDLGIYKYCC